MDTVVLLFTDVEGSTRAWATSPGMVRSLERHDAVLRDVFDAHDGVEFKHTGDGLCATFPSVGDAVLAAVDSQRRLAVEDWGDGPALRVRVAVHAGAAHRRGGDWFGLSLSHCARLLGAAHGGQVLLSGAAGTLLAEAPAEGVDVLHLGSISLRDFPESEQVWQVTAAGLEADFPPLRSEAPVGNLPAELSPLVGRGQQVAQVCAAMRDARLITLTGPGGVGKTRLALASAEALANESFGGAWLVELASGQQSEDVDFLVAAGLGFIPRPGASLRETVIEGIGARSILLVLDNCEHLLDGVASTVADLLRKCEHVAIITTSREPLAVEGEWVLGVPSLEIATDAVELFVARATAAYSSFDAEDRQLIEEICGRLDGIPLAIELAASRTRSLPLQDLSARLRDHLDVVTAGRRGRIERHATVRAAIDWSWGLLSEEERVVFARLSVFAGRFDIDAAESIIGVSGEADPVELLSTLVDKSMLVVETSAVAPFGLLEPLRQYGAEQLAASGDAEQTGRRHAEHFAALNDRLGAQTETTDEIRASAQLGAARDNIRAAFAFAAARADADLCLRIVTPLSDYSTTHIWTEPWSWCEAALAMLGADDHPLRVAAVLFASGAAWQMGDQERSLALADATVLECDEGDEPWRAAQERRANALMYLGRFDDSREAAAASVGDPAQLRSSGDLRRHATLLNLRNLTLHPDVSEVLLLLAATKSCSPSTHAFALHVAGMTVASTDPAAAVDYQRAAAELARATGAVLVEGFALAALAGVEADLDPVQGVSRYADVLAHYLRVGNRAHLRGFARGLLPPLVGCEQWEAAATVEGATRSSALFGAPLLKRRVEEAEARTRRTLGDQHEVFAARGIAMTDDEFVAYVAGVAAILAP